MCATPDVALPGEDTLLDAWETLTGISRGARLIRLPDATVAVFPEWAPLNNAVLHAPADRAPCVAAEVADLYAAAAVRAWAFWLPTRAPSFHDVDAVRAVGPLRRDTTTLVMRTVLNGTTHRPDARVRRTSVASATRATDEPVPASALEPPEDLPGFDAWVLCEGGVAICGAWSQLRADDCGIYTVGTVPDWRRRGLARALTGHVLSHAQRLGARTATLQSTEMGEPLYASLGFTPVGRYEEWTP